MKIPKTKEADYVSFVKERDALEEAAILGKIPSAIANIHIEHLTDRYKDKIHPEGQAQPEGGHPGRGGGGLY